MIGIIFPYRIEDKATGEVKTGKSYSILVCGTELKVDEHTFNSMNFEYILYKRGYYDNNKKVTTYRYSVDEPSERG